MSDVFASFFLQKNDTLSSSDHENCTLQKLVSYMELHYPEHISLDNLAEIANVTANIYAVFSRYHRYAAANEIPDQYRIEQACEMFARYY